MSDTSNEIIIQPGTMYGRLKVLYKAEEKKHDEICYVCECQCKNKNIVTITSKSLRYGRTKSCGCLQVEAARNNKKIKKKNDIDLVGKQFGMLRVVKRVSGKGVSSIWECKCKCGNTKNIVQNSLTGGHSKSCGCTIVEYGKKSIKRNVGIINGSNVSKLKSKKLSEANTSGSKGVSYAKNVNRWHAYIGFQNKLYSLGYYDNTEDAVSARKIAEDKLFVNFLDWYNNKFENKTRGQQNET